MNAYIWVVMVLLGISILQKTYMCLMDEFPKRTRKGEAIDVVFNIVMVMWGLLLIFR